MQERLGDRLAALEGLAEGQQAINRLLTTMLEHQQEVLEEIRRDAKQTQRLWVRLAQRYGWLEEDDLDTSGQ